MDKRQVFLGSGFQPLRIVSLPQQYPPPPPAREFGFKHVKRLLLVAAIAALAVVETQAQIPITLTGTNGVRGMKITFGGDGNYRPSNVASFTRGSANIANSSHASLGSATTALFFSEAHVVSPFPYKSAIEGSFDLGQYVPFDSGLPMSRTVSGSTTSFNVVGLRFFISFGSHYLSFVTDSASSLPAGSGEAYTYTVNSERSFSLDPTVGATFDQAFNIGTFRLGGDSDGIQMNIVPEPEEYALVVGLGLLAFAFLRNWRRRAAAKPAEKAPPF